jgi:hypothetical protein
VSQQYFSTMHCRMFVKRVSKFTSLPNIIPSMPALAHAKSHILFNYPLTHIPQRLTLTLFNCLLQSLVVPSQASPRNDIAPIHLWRDIRRPPYAELLAPMSQIKATSIHTGKQLGPRPHLRRVVQPAGHKLLKPGPIPHKFGPQIPRIQTSTDNAYTSTRQLITLSITSD